MSFFFKSEKFIKSLFNIAIPSIFVISTFYVNFVFSQDDLSSIKKINLVIFYESLSPGGRIQIKHLPSSLQKNILKVFRQNHIQAKIISPASYKEAFIQKTSTKERIKLLINSSNSIGEGGLSDFLLIEIKAERYGFITNGFKWIIKAKLSYYYPKQKNILNSLISASAFLPYVHYTDFEALEQINPDFLNAISIFIQNKISPLKASHPRLAIRGSRKNSFDNKENNLDEDDLNKLNINKSGKKKLKIRRKKRKRKK